MPQKSSANGSGMGVVIEQLPKGQHGFTETCVWS